MVTKKDEKLAKVFAKMFKKLMLPRLVKLQNSLDEIEKILSSKDDVVKLRL